jgi:hypothetical protein
MSASDSSVDYDYDPDLGDAKGHFISINLSSTKSDQGILAARKATTNGFQAVLSHRQDELRIAACTIYTPSDGGRRFRMITQPSHPSIDATNTSKTDRWL